VTFLALVGRVWTGLRIRLTRERRQMLARDWQNMRLH
jgi:hypothetical protein